MVWRFFPIWALLDIGKLIRQFPENETFQLLIVFFARVPYIWSCESRMQEYIVGSLSIKLRRSNCSKLTNWLTSWSNHLLIDCFFPNLKLQITIQKRTVFWGLDHFIKIAVSNPFSIKTFFCPHLPIHPSFYPAQYSFALKRSI